jgi:3-deoxy-D-manno-octulosonic-acid transferase
VVTRADLWPLLILTARDRGIRLGLIAAAVRAGSTRLRWPARRVLAPAYAALDLAAAVGPEDVLRLVSLGVAPERIVVAGDPRYDAVMERLAFRPSSFGEATLVAGSTWPRDERVLLAAFAEVHHAWEGARLILAPHEPSPRALARVAVLARRLRLPEPRSYRDAVIADPLRVVDEVGPLAVLYGLGSVAYVGGGFNRSGLHSVLEPAAWSMPVIVGPRDMENPDANRLASVRALERLPARAPGRALRARWLHWLEHPELRRAVGAEALAAVEAGTGAADRCADLVERLL